MQNLLLLLARYGNVILFIFLEILCFYLIVNYNQSQKEIYLNSSNLFSGFILDKKENTKSYIGLKQVNEQLHHENARLLQKTFNRRNEELTRSSMVSDTLSRDTITRDTSIKYSIIAATVINNSVRLRNNTITLNKGKNHGIKPGMAVISSDGVVGVVRNVSNKYSQVLSILNSQSRISAKIKKNNYHGNLLWKGGSPKRMTLEAVPKHALFSAGDTLTTSGYSSIFPKDILIGTIEDFRIPSGSSNYFINVLLFNDLAKLNHVYVIENLDLHEIKNLEKELDE
jgi:rod shape-determining protein MreC